LDLRAVGAGFVDEGERRRGPAGLDGHRGTFFSDADDDGTTGRVKFRSGGAVQWLHASGRRRI
ncbi:hypothetical protein BZG30_33505, partial [Escherichia coli]|nr:hypothetical protein [Escherichia coli]